MNIYRKTIILSSRESRTPIMKLDIENKNNITIGTLISFDNKYQEGLLLGIKCGNEIIKQNIHIENKKCQFKLPQNINLQDELSCTIVDTHNDKFEPILWGTSSNKKTSINIASSLKNMVNKIQSNRQSVSKQTIANNNETTTHTSINANPQKISDTYSQISLEPEQLSIDDIAVASTTAQAESLFDSTDEEIESTIDRELGSTHNFYNLIADQLDELFAIYPRERNLEQLVDNSMWCRIDTDVDNKYYVVGIIKEDNDIKYICYGVPGNYNTQPPIEMREYSQWLPTDTTDPYNNGYWVMYQSSDTGENILIE